MENKEQKIKIFESEVNRRLKVVWQDGKKLLNTKNTNYSYGTLVDVLEHGLDTIPISKVSSVLLLGMGAGSIIKSLRTKYDSNAPVTAVELDSVVIKLAHKKFNIEHIENVDIHNMEAWDYVAQCDTQFDLIIVDIFIDIHVPDKFYKPKFWKMIEKIVTPNGFVLFNAGIDLDEAHAQKFVAKLPDSFIYQKNYNVLQSNTVIIMQKVFN